MPFHPMLRFPLPTLVVVLIVAACCERPQPPAAKVPIATSAASPAPASAAERYPATLTQGIDFRQAGYPAFLASVSGLSHYEPWGRWSDGSPVVFQFAHPLPTRFTLILTAHAFGPNIGIPIPVKAGADEQTLTLTAEDQTQRLDFTLATPVDRLEFHIPRPTSPAALKQGEDPRKLGIGFVQWRLETVEAPATSATPPVEPDYAATITATTDRLEIEQGSFITATLTLTNRGRLTWASEAPHPVNLSYHLLDSDGKTLTHDNPRTSFPQPVAPGQTTTLTLKLGADRIPGPGNYRMEFDLVQEGQTWFAAKGSPTLTIPVTVTPPKQVLLDEAQLAQPQTSALQVGDLPEFGALWRLIQNTLVYPQPALRDWIKSSYLRNPASRCSAADWSERLAERLRVPGIDPDDAG